jgi:hypothetical protein
VLPFGVVVDRPVFASPEPPTSDASMPALLPGSPLAPLVRLCWPGAFCETPGEGGEVEEPAAPVVLEEPALEAPDEPPLLPPSASAAAGSATAAARTMSVPSFI